MSVNTNDTPLPTRALVDLVAAVRKDTQATIATADGNLAALQQDASGNLRVTSAGGQGTIMRALYDLIGRQSELLERLASLDSEVLAEHLLRGDVRVRGIDAGEAHLGQVGGHFANVDGNYDGVARAIIPAAGNYAALDVISNSTSAGAMMAFRVGRELGGSGVVTQGLVTFSAQSMVARTRLWLFRQRTRSSVLEDNVAFSLDDDDREKAIGYLDFPALVDVGEVVYAQNLGDRIGFQCESNSQDIYGIWQFVDAETNEAANMTMRCSLGVIQD